MSRNTYVPGTAFVDITAPGGIEALLNFHRATFGDARMEAAAGGDGGGAPAAGDSGTAPVAGAPAAPPASGTAPVAGAPVAPPAATGETLPDDPVALKAEIARLRRENASDRTTAKATAAEEATAALVQKLGQALGLVGEQAPTADQLATQLSESQTQARQAAVELAVYKTAAGSDADPAALLDSRAFLEKVKDLNPTDGDFAAKVTAAIKEAVTANPKLKAAPEATRSGIPHPAGGPGEGGAKPTTLDAAVAAAYQPR